MSINHRVPRSYRKKWRKHPRSEPQLPGDGPLTLSRAAGIDPAFAGPGIAAVITGIGTPQIVRCGTLGMTGQREMTTAAGVIGLRTIHDR